MYKTSKEENEILTRTGKGTPMGEFLRRYWWPIGISAHLKIKPTFIRVFGEDLVLFRDGTAAKPASSAPTARTGGRIYVSAMSRKTVCAAVTMAGCTTATAGAGRFPASRPTAS